MSVTTIVHEKDNFGAAPLTRADSVSSITSNDNYYYNRPRKMTQVRSCNRETVLALGEELRRLLHEQQCVIKDRRYHLKSYPACLIGQELVSWLVDRKEVETRKDAVVAMQKLLDNGVLHHVCDDHPFKDEKLFYRFRRDDGTYAGPIDAPLVAKGQRMYSRIKTGAPQMIADRKYHLHSYKQCFVGKEFVDWLMQEGDTKTRADALELGRKLVTANVIRHVCGDHDFKDDVLFYRFCNDEKSKENLDMKRLLGSGSSPQVEKKLPSPPEKKRSSKNKFLKGDVVYASPDDMVKSANHTNQDKVFAIEEEFEDEYMVMKPADADPMYVQMHSTMKPLESAGTIKDKLTAGISNIDNTFSNSPAMGRKIVTVDDLIHPDAPFVKRTVTVVSDPVGYGFVIRGNSPVYIHSVDPMGPATIVGLHVGEFLYSVNGEMVLQATHQQAAKIILMGPSSTSLVTLCPTHLCSS